MNKLLCLLLALCLLFGCLPGCSTGLGEHTPIPSETGTQNGADTYNQHLVYTLTEADGEKFSADLEALEQLYLQNAPIEEINAAEEALEALSDFIYDQSSIAQVIYCCDTTDEAAKAQYLKSREILNGIADALMLCARRIYESDAQDKENFFLDWTDGELERLMHYTSRVAQLEQRNAELLVSYRDLENPAEDPQMAVIYREFVQNNNEIAGIYGYDNYYSYAHRVNYERDYTPQTVEKMHMYGRLYLAPACEKALIAHGKNFGQLESSAQQLISGLEALSYNAIGVNYVERYLKSLPDAVAAPMNEMFEQERVVFTQHENARQAAFTTLVGMEPFCYFGPGRQTSSALIHELGHYYGAKMGNLSKTPLDLAEVQSQGNEWIFLAFLEEELPEDVYDAYVDFKLYEVIAGTLLQITVDAFERAVYAREDIGSMTEKDFEDLMAEAAKPFGGVEFFNRNITDLQKYWKMVVLESPVYYISYAVSSMVALNLFPIAVQDREQAVEIYRKLNDLETYDNGFLDIIEQAGLPHPFQADIYLYLYEEFP